MLEAILRSKETMNIIINTLVYIYKFKEQVFNTHKTVQSLE